MSHGWRLGSLLLLLSVTACGGASHPGWKTLPVPIYADSAILNSSQALSDLKDAFQFWEARAGKKIFDFKGQWNSGSPYAGDPTKPDSILGNVIFFQNPWPYSPNYVGMTTVQNDTDGPKAAMVMINSNSQFCHGDCNFDSRVSSRKTFAHELGHFIGLNHIQDRDDIMYPDAQPGGKIDGLNVDQATLDTLTQGN